MGVDSFFFDSYAFLEIIDGNPAYEPFKKGGIVTTKLNLLEVHHALLRKFDRKKAEEYYYKLVRYAVDIDDATLILASLFRAQQQGKGLSYVDCIGYMLARKHNVKFLTGDKEFKYLENVAFVK